MTLAVWKFPIGDNGKTQMPAGAKPLTFGFQSGEPYVWCLVDPDAPKVCRKITFVGTGQVLHPSWAEATYVATAFEGPFVFHLFDFGEVSSEPQDEG